MKFKPHIGIKFLLIVMILFPNTVLSDQAKKVQLPKPEMDGGRPLMQVLKDRHSTRSFGTQEISPQTLSNLLWAAFGINRPESGKRTAPSALNWQEIDIYVATRDGLYLYDAQDHSLTLVIPEDIRSETGNQSFVGKVPLNFVYVADLSKTGNASSEQKDFCSAADTGFIGQNVYLYCASEGLATVVRASMDRSNLAKIMKLRPDQKITLAQSIGYPIK